MIMHYFKYKRKKLYCENVEVSRLAGEFGTPLYLYSQRTFMEHFEKIKKAFAALDPLICYSVKANSNLAILKALVDNGAGLDIVSGGELYRAKQVGCPAERVVYASVGKTDKEIEDAVEFGIFMFNVESLPELEKINTVAGRLNKKVDVALRVNPDITPKTHKYITTGKKETKFGMDIYTVEKIFLNRDGYPNLNMTAVHVHIGSQITDISPFIKTIKKIQVLLKRLEAQGVRLKYFNLGGGLGIVYHKEKAKTAKMFADKLVPLLKDISLKVILEPGRFIIGSAGILVTKVIYVKNTASKKFIIVDAGMNDLIRPSLYEAYHEIVPVTENRNPAIGKGKLADVVGPICESSDFLGKNRSLSAAEGDYLAVLGAGAYGFSMSSNYNSRARAAEVLVDGSEVYCIREREKYSDLVKAEHVIM